MLPSPTASPTDAKMNSDLCPQLSRVDVTTLVSAVGSKKSRKYELCTVLSLANIRILTFGMFQKIKRLSNGSELRVL